MYSVKVAFFILLFAVGAYAGERAVYLPPEEHCSQIFFTTKSAWTLRIHRSGAASLVHANSFGVHRLPPKTFDFAELYQDVVLLSENPVWVGRTFYIHVALREAAPHPHPDIISYGFPSADTDYVRTLFDRALALPTSFRWPGLDSYIKENPIFESHAK